MSTTSITTSRVVDQLRGGIYLLPPGIRCNYMGRGAVLSAIRMLQQQRKSYDVPAAFLDHQMNDTHYEDILGKQLAMNRQTWAALQKHGVTEGRQLGLDFSYNAPSHEAADKLCAQLLSQTDYEVKVESAGWFLRRKWQVEGRTQNTAVSPAVLDQWVTRMVSAGKEHSCDFDGWGTSV